MCKQCLESNGGGGEYPQYPEGTVYSEWFLSNLRQKIEHTPSALKSLNELIPALPRAQLSPQH